MNTTFSIPNTYGDHMVFQQDMPIRIVGTAPGGMEITVRMDGPDIAREIKTVTEKNGTWKAVFKPFKAGGPYEITITDAVGTIIRLQDVMVGEVWFLGGQSNMEFPVSGDNFFYSLRNGKEIAAAANDPLLRVFRMPRTVSPDGPCDNAPTGTCWKTATSAENVSSVSAIGYLFGQRLRKRLGVPVGLIHSNWGGCRIEPWIDEQTLRRHSFKTELEQIKYARIQDGKRKKQTDSKIFKKNADEFNAWIRKFRNTAPETTAEALAGWANPDEASGKWTPIRITDCYRKGVATPGVAWYRTTVTIPDSWPNKQSAVRFDCLNDCGSVFWDGKPIGKTDVDEPDYWAIPRRFALTKAQAKPGKHLLCVRLENHSACGYVNGPCLVCDDWLLDLSKEPWEERIEFRASCAIGPRPCVPQLAVSNNFAQRLTFSVPSTLFNAMFAPFRNLHFRGALWYQGCSNAGDYARYDRLQRALVESWRRATGNPNLYFLAVELAGFMQHTPENRLPDDFWKESEPVESAWSHIRVEQEKIRFVRHCDIASAVDIGDHSDIHPANKAEVARRLEALAAKLCYHAKGLATGPRAVAAKREGNAIRVSFENVGKGLELRDGDTFGEHAWAICGRDKKWVWADARLEGKTVLVFSPDVPNPVSVRYAWDAYPPNMRLWNKDGFPAFPVPPLRAK